MMRRAHRLESSQRMAFCDSTSSCDQQKHTVTFLMQPTAAGAVCSGVFITKSSCHKSYKTAFQLLADELGDMAFAGQKYPAIIMTDDSKPEREALHDIWPLAVLLLCLFHICQAVWRWLLDGKHGIRKDHRQSFMHDFLLLCRSKTESEANELYSISVHNARNYPSYLEYLKGLWARRAEWCLCYRYIT